MINFIKNNWIILLILIVLTFVVIKYYINSKSQKENNFNKNVLNQIPVYNSIGSVKTNNSNTSTNSSVNTNTTTVVTTTETKPKTLSIGDKLYALSGLNVYKNKNIGPSTVYKHYNQGDYIGTFLAKDDSYYRIITEEEDWFTGSKTATTVYVIPSQVYSK